MRIGYPCINRSVGCTANSTFRLSSYSEKRLKETIGKNLDCLRRILVYNLANNLLFFRIGSDLVPFASHPICRFNWAKYFSDDLSALGGYVRKHDMRISMHPDQFTLINSPRQDVNNRSAKELAYHCRILDHMGLNSTAKVQFHVGGVYGDKQAACLRFIRNYDSLPESTKKRLVVENDHRLFSVEDCLRISDIVGIPVVFDVFHHSLMNRTESFREAIKRCMKTWRKKDGSPMVDYSSQQNSARAGVHARSIDPRHFKSFLNKRIGFRYYVRDQRQGEKRSDSAEDVEQIDRAEFRSACSNSSLLIISQDLYRNRTNRFSKRLCKKEESVTGSIVPIAYSEYTLRLLSIHVLRLQ